MKDNFLRLLPAYSGGFQRAGNNAISPLVWALLGVFAVLVVVGVLLALNNKKKK